ncbi:hypothetical protein ACFQMA_12210 [Halosimplex aquaticum]|uniref:DUF8163 domain-containing protein n=1 Tax=Halosimplex aquaticum TaxID=3026162 RepID=A0ABD5Y2U5_9EURY|nr:hypothetical protein [Halosimplex aquaticum]
MSRTNTRTGGDRVSADTIERGWTDGRWRSWVDALVLVAVGAAFWLVAGATGVAAAGALALAWLVSPNVAVFVAGVVATVALVPEGAPRSSTVLPLAPLGGLLLTATITGDRLRDPLAVIIAFALVGAVAAAAYSLTNVLWVAVVAVLVASAAGFVSLDLIALSEFGENR